MCNRLRLGWGADLKHWEGGARGVGTEMSGNVSARQVSPHGNVSPWLASVSVHGKGVSGWQHVPSSSAPRCARNRAFLRSCDALVPSACASSRRATSRARFCSSDRKYSPLSSCRSTLRGVCAGGKGVAAFSSAVFFGRFFGRFELFRTLVDRQ